MVSTRKGKIENETCKKCDDVVKNEIKIIENVMSDCDFEYDKGIRINVMIPDNVTNNDHTNGCNDVDTNNIVNDTDAVLVENDIDIYCKKIMNTSLTKVKIFYPRLCLDCSGIFKSKFTFSKHKRLGRCKTKSETLNDDKESKKQNVTKKNSKFYNSDLSDYVDNENLIFKVGKQNGFVDKLAQFKEEDEVNRDSDVIDNQHESIDQCLHIMSDKNIGNLSNRNKSRGCSLDKNEMDNHCNTDVTNEIKTISPLMECAICSRFYKSKRSFLNHLKYCSKSNKFPLIQTDQDHDYVQDISIFFPSFEDKRKPKSLNQYIKCKDCCTLYINKHSFLTHKNKNLCDVNIKRVPCIYNDCYLKFTRYEHMISHIPQYHNDNSYISQTKYFINFNEFENWKFKQQNERFVYLVKTRGIKTYKGTAYYYYECQFNAVNSKKRGGQRKTERRKRHGIIPHVDCPARMMVAKNIETGYVAVNYIEKHTHELSCSQAKYQRYPKQVINHIAEQLRQGVSPSEILEFYLKDLCQADNFEEKDLKLTHMMNLKFINNLKATLRRQGKLPKAYKPIVKDNSLSSESEVKDKHENNVNYEMVTPRLEMAMDYIEMEVDDDFQMISAEEEFNVISVFNMDDFRIDNSI